MPRRCLLYTSYKTSPDGKVWRAAVQSEPIADRSTVYKNPFRNVWVYSMRHNVRVDANKLVRARDYNENTDPEAGTKKAEALLSAFWFGPWANEQHHTCLLYTSLCMSLMEHSVMPD